MSYVHISVDHATTSTESIWSGSSSRGGAPRSSVLSGGQFSRVVGIDGEASRLGEVAGAARPVWVRRGRNCDAVAAGRPVGKEAVISRKRSQAHRGIR
jgi:hypothetical protein